MDKFWILLIILILLIIRYFLNMKAYNQGYELGVKVGTEQTARYFINQIGKGAIDYNNGKTILDNSILD